MSDRKTTCVFAGVGRTVRAYATHPRFFGTLATMGLALACDPFLGRLVGGAWLCGAALGAVAGPVSRARSRIAAAGASGGMERRSGGGRWTAAAESAIQGRATLALVAAALCLPGRFGAVTGPVFFLDWFGPTDNCAGGVPPAAAFLVAVAALQTLVSAALDVGAAFRDRPRQPSHETVKGNKP